MPEYMKNLLSVELSQENPRNVIAHIQGGSSFLFDEWNFDDRVLLNYKQGALVTILPIHNILALQFEDAE